MKRFLVVTTFLIVQSLAVAQPDLSFKGVRLGMSRAALDSLVAASRWSYVYSMRHKGPDTTHNEFLFIGADTCWNQAQRSTDTFTILSCSQIAGQESCAHFQVTAAEFAGDSVHAIYVKSRSYMTDEDYAIANYTQSVLSELTNRFGHPQRTTEIDEVIASPILERMQPDKSYSLARWEWRDGKKRGSLLSSVSVWLHKQPEGEMEVVVIFMGREQVSRR